jgi:2-phosphoglycerate kinase
LVDRDQVHVYLIGGSSSVGKTTLAEELRNRLGFSILRVDDLVKGSPDPRIRFPQGVPNVWQRRPEELRDGLISKGEAIRPQLGSVIAGLLKDRRSSIVEGEGVQPQLALQWSADASVRFVFVVEEDENRLRETLSSRASGWKFEQLSSREQANVTGMNALYGSWLREEATTHGLSWTVAHPFATLADRVLSLPGWKM